MIAVHAVSMNMRYRRLNQGCSQNGSRRSRAIWVSGAPPAQIQRRNFKISDMALWLAGRYGSSTLASWVG